MSKGRLEAFSDGVIAIIITVMVLELKAPQGSDPAALAAVLPPFLGYVLSFIFVGIYWNNHHHLFHAVRRVRGMALWGNLHLLFWLSLVPTATAWMGATRFAPWPTAVYGVVLLMCAVAWEVERRILIRQHGRDSALTRAVGAGAKEWVSLILYALAIGAAFLSPWTACGLYCVVAALWFVPDRRIERELEEGEE